MKVGKICGIDLHINGWFIFHLSLFFIAGLLDKGLVLFGVVLLHELAHTLVAMRLGIKVLEIELLPFGGVARLGSELALNPRKETLVALAGPLTNILLIALALAARNYGLWHEELSPFFIQCNVLLAAFNLLPALPLDGGRVLRAYLALSLGVRRASYFCIALGQGAAVVITTLATLGLMWGVSGLDLIILGLFIFYAATREKKTAPYLFVRQLTQKKSELAEMGLLPAEMIVSLPNVPLREVISFFVPQKFHLVLLLNQDYQCQRIISETEVVDALLEKGLDFPLGALGSGK